jgi:hypothetical protein
MKTLKQIMLDAERYQAIRESGEIVVASIGSGFALRHGGADESDKKKLDDYTHRLALAFKSLENAKCCETKGAN